MTTTPFTRPPRRVGPQPPSGDIELQEPPELPEVAPAGMRAITTVLPMALMSGSMLLMVATPGQGRTGGIMASMMGASVVAMVIGQVASSRGDRKHQVGGDRRDYLRFLAQARRRVRRLAEQQRAAATWQHPDPAGLWSLAMTTRLWERRASHPDFAEVRVGTGPQRPAVRIIPPQTKPVADLDPVAAKALRRFLRAYATVSGQPVAVALRGFSLLRVDGDDATVRDVVRAMLAQLVTLHSPADVRIAVCADPAAAEHWAWAKWLPHAQHPADRDAAGPRRLFAATAEELTALVGEDLDARPRFESQASTPTAEEPFVLIVADGVRLPSGSRLLAGGYRNVLLVDVGGTAGSPPGVNEQHTLHLRADAAEVAVVRTDRVGQATTTPLGVPDRLSAARASVLARLLAGHGGTATTAADAGDPTSADLDLPSLLGLTDVDALDVDAMWRPRAEPEQLRVPIGVGSDGQPVVLDLKESAQNGMGPHGLLIGATGSGKSELLRTLVLALVATHSSETLNLVLVDFKGGATFAGLDDLPHVSAVITNLADEAALVERMYAALHGELVRRQELLRALGNHSSRRDYERARLAGAPLEPLPTLFVVVDEFSELITAHPDFIELFAMIGRLGRSLGVHLLLASQRLDDGRIHQLEGHLSYRIGLRTFSAMESRAVIGVPDAYELPSSPGSGYLRSDVATITRFKAAYVSGPARRRAARVRQDVVAAQVVPFTGDAIALPDGAAAPDVVPDAVPDVPETPDTETPSRTVLAEVVDRLRDAGPPAHQVWLPPLERPATLDQVLPPLLPDPRLGLRPDGDPLPPLSVPLGLVDRPFEQQRDLLVVDLAGLGGHVGIAGGPQSGKSTLLRSLICGLALTHTPHEVQFLCLDFGGGTLAPLAALPHVGSVTGRLDAERVTRTVAELTALLAERERLFAEMGVESMPAYRARRDPGDADAFADVFLVVDGWFTLRQDFEDLEAAVRQLIARGLTYGIHVVITTARWSEVHYGVRDQIGTQLELRLGDAVDSVIDLRAAAQVPRLPGRGLTGEKLHFLGALPRIDGLDDVSDLAEATRDLVAQVDAAWPGTRAMGVRTLPSVLAVEDLPRPEGDLRVVLGLDEERLAPVWHDFETTPCLTVLGDDRSGKTNLLRVMARAIVARYGPDEARVVTVDWRRQLLDEVPPDMRLGLCVSRETTAAAIADAVAGLMPRLPGPEVSPEQLRRRDWWTGPKLFVLVDDYDLLAGHESPLMPLADVLPQAGDIGLHVVLARAASGAMRLSMDPLLRRVQELNTPDVMLSCPPAEGPQLGGVKPRLLPPGRALLCTRRGGRLIQTGYAAETALTPALAG